MRNTGSNSKRGPLGHVRSAEPTTNTQRIDRVLPAIFFNSYHIEAIKKDTSIVLVNRTATTRWIAKVKKQRTITTYTFKLVDVGRC